MANEETTIKELKVETQGPAAEAAKKEAAELAKKSAAEQVKIAAAQRAEQNASVAKASDGKALGAEAGKNSAAKQTSDKKAGTADNSGKKEARQQAKKNGKPMSKVTKLIGSLGFKIAIVAAIIVLLFVGISWGYSFGYDLFTQKAVEDAPGRDVIVTIYDDMNENEIAALLYNKGLISDKTNFVLFEKLFTSERFGIIPGEYTLNTSMTPRELLSAMSSSIAQETTAAPTLGLYETETTAETTAED